MAQIKPMLLILFSLVLLLGVGSLYNNLNASGLIVSQTTLTCSTTINILNPNCVGSNPTGCQINAENCGLSDNSVQFLNAQSPFTFLFSGNIFGFFQSLTSNSAAYAGPFSQSGGGAYYSATCAVEPVTNINGTFYGLHYWNVKSCTEITPDNTNMSKADTFQFAPWNANQSPPEYQKLLSFYNLVDNSTAPIPFGFDCSWIMQVNSTGGGYTWYGCGFYSPPVDGYESPVAWSFLLSIWNGNGALHGAYTHENVYVQPENWDTDACIQVAAGLEGTGPLWSQQCLNMISGVNTTASGSGFNFGLLTPIILFIIGIALFLIGLGLQISAGGTIFGSGTNLGVGANAQGTRLAQVVGIGLIVWTPLYSEFGTWISPANFPYGISVIIFFLITGMFFFGIFWQMLSLE